MSLGGREVRYYCSLVTDEETKPRRGVQAGPNTEVCLTLLPSLTSHLRVGRWVGKTDVCAERELKDEVGVKQNQRS